MGEDISECRYLIVDETDEEILEGVAAYIASGNESYKLDQSVEFKVPLKAGKFAIVAVLYDVYGEPLDDYFTQIFELTTGIENIGYAGTGIDFDWNSNVVSVAEAGVIELFDTSGRLLKKVNGNNVSIADLETGIYIVRYNKNVVKVVKK